MTKKDAAIRHLCMATSERKSQVARIRDALVAVAVAAQEVDDDHTQGLPASLGAAERLHVALVELDAARG